MKVSDKEFINMNAMENDEKHKESIMNKMKLLNALYKKSCFFFVGSGISIQSGIASVGDVLLHTCDKFLTGFDKDNTCVPAKVSRREYICKNIQPELFYSVLLECAGKECVLEMWNCLKQDHFTEYYNPNPNFIHHFIVAYSYCAKVPIFTTNYDKMLEIACKKLRIPFCTCLDVPSSELLRSNVIICKLHGDLKENVGNKVGQNDIGTTMSHISTKNIKWLKFIKSFVDKYDLCFWGYSGRDIDYYPFLREYANQSDRQSYWTIGNPEKSETDKTTAINAASIKNINMIRGYPSEMEKELLNVLECFDSTTTSISHIRSSIGQEMVSKEAKDIFLNEIERSIKAVDVSFDKNYFWMQLMRNTGHNKSMGEVIGVLIDKNYARKELLTEKDKYVLLAARIALARELADFSEYTKLSKELMRTAKKGLPDKDARRYLELARVEYISSLQMIVPSALSLKVPLFRRRIGLLLMVRLGFGVLNLRFHPSGELYNLDRVLAQECKVRTLAIDCRIPFLSKQTGKSLERLRESAYCIGNYGTVIGVNKYLARMKKDKRFKEELQSFGTIVSDISALSIAERNDNPDESLKHAVENSNTLNIVKAIFAKKHKINQGDSELFISDDDKKRLYDAINSITPNSLKKTLIIIGKREKLLPNDVF